jgi:hypothetical protein
MPTAGPEPEGEPFRLIAEGPAIAELEAEAGSPFPGKDELNLAEFPIALVTDRIPAGTKTLRFEDRIYDERRGQHIARRLVVTASDEYGLPTAKDDEVILGLVQMTRRANNFTDRTVQFSRSDLIRLLRWPDTGPSYRRLSLSFHRWLGVSLHYDNAWWDKSQQKWTTLGFHILESFKLADSGKVGGPPSSAPLSRFTWNEDLFRSFQAGYLKQLDLDFYLGLAHPTAKRMYRFLDKRFYRRDELVFDLKEFAFDHVGLSRTYEGATQLVRKLAPAIEELESKGFLEPAGSAERFRKESSRSWKVVFRRRGRSSWADEPEGPSPSPPASPPALAPTPPSELVAELAGRGVTASIAEELAGSFAAERIRHHLDVHDWLLARKDRRVLRSPAGFLVQSIRRDYAPPVGYEAPEARARKADEGRKRTEAERSRRRDDERREALEQERAWAYWRSLDDAAQERLWSEALAAAAPFLAQQYRRHAGRSKAQEERYRDLILEIHIRERMAGRGAP